MMRCIVRFYENAKKIINDSQKAEKKVSWGIISTQIEKLYLELSQMKFQDPKQSKGEMDHYFDKLMEDIDNEFRKLTMG